MNAALKEPTTLQTWVIAMRPRTLPLALSCIAMGGFLAAADGHFSASITFLCAFTTLLLQILSNLANDYGDSIHGADSAGRAGPARAVQSGRISPHAMFQAIIATALLAVVSGLLLIWLALGLERLLMGLTFGVLGGTAIWASITYTAGNRPYGYVGLGDLSVLIFFGWLGVMGTYFLQTHLLAPLVWLPATSCGLFAVAVLNINNVRDLESDRKAGKRSIPVRIGRAKAARYHWALLGLGLLCAIAYVLLSYQSPGQFLFLLTLPLLARSGQAVQHTPSENLDPALKRMALTSLLFVLLFGVGQLL
ncbi:MAG: 1,4-dihydroxy-2-naphthoate polyprenyltransferase [Caldilineaceae bacterium]